MRGRIVGIREYEATKKTKSRNEPKYETNDQAKL